MSDEVGDEADCGDEPPLEGRCRDCGVVSYLGEESGLCAACEDYWRALEPPNDPDPRR